MSVALGVAFMLIGAVYSPLDMASVCISSALIAFIYIEIGSPYTWLAWLSTSLLTAIVYSSSPMWVMYLLVFGIYPIIKGYIEKLRRVLWWPLKLIFGAVSMTVMFLACTYVLGLPLMEDELLGLPTSVIYLVTALLALVAFAAYDVFLTAVVKVYMFKVRPKLKNILK